MVKQAEGDIQRKLAEERQRELEAQSRLPDIIHPCSGSDPSISLHFISQRVLGRGAYGEVYQVAEATTGAVYARKRIHLDLAKSSGHREEDVKKEVDIMKKLRHKHIATVLLYAKIDDTFSIFMTPVADCNLKSFLDQCVIEGFPH